MLKKLIEYVRCQASNFGSKKHYGNGLLDADYALKYYNKYKKEFQKNKINSDKDVIERNEKEIITFENTGCVEGCWNRNDHESMIVRIFVLEGVLDFLMIKAM